MHNEPIHLAVASVPEMNSPSCCHGSSPHAFELEDAQRSDFRGQGKFGCWRNADHPGDFWDCDTFRSSRSVFLCSRCSVWQPRGSAFLISLFSRRRLLLAGLPLRLALALALRLRLFAGMFRLAALRLHKASQCRGSPEPDAVRLRFRNEIRRIFRSV